MAVITIGKAFDLEYAGGSPVLDGTDGTSDVPCVKDWMEAAAQTFKKGDPVYLDSDGKIALVTASSNLVVTILGFAMNDATGVTDSPCSVRTITDGDRIVCNIKDSGGDSVTIQGMLGDVVGFDLDTTGGTNNLVANPAKTATTNPFGRISHFWTEANGYADSAEALGDTNGRAVVTLRSFGFQG